MAVMYIEKIGFFTHLLDYVTIFLRLTLPKRQFRYADAFHALRREARENFSA
jgi:hypothetical protein